METDLYYYRARFYDAKRGTFLSEDSVGFSLGENNHYAYVGNSPTYLRDPSGFSPYLVCRPFGGDSKWLDHCFVVTNSNGPGSGDVHSYGQQNNGNLGPVDQQTTGTLQADRDAWNRANSDRNVDYKKIPASDGDVRRAVRDLKANQDYSATGIGGANSNSAARAIADRAAGTPIPLPGKRLKLGQSSFDELEFKVRARLCGPQI